jgi:methionine-rich copper-binding protein CopC
VRRVALVLVTVAIASVSLAAAAAPSSAHAAIESTDPANGQLLEASS